MESVTGYNSLEVLRSVPMAKKEGRIREPELRHAAPTAQERARGDVVHCEVCKLDWAAAHADRSRRLCLNHARARVRDAVLALREWRRDHAPSDEERAVLLDAQKNACAICVEPVGTKMPLYTIRLDEVARGLVCEPCGRAVDRILDDPKRRKRALGLYEG